MNITETIDKLDAMAASLRDMGEDVEAIERAIDLLRGLDRIHGLYDGEEWDSDTTADTSAVLLSLGLPVNEPGHYDDEEE